MYEVETVQVWVALGGVQVQLQEWEADGDGEKEEEGEGERDTVGRWENVSEGVDVADRDQETVADSEVLVVLLGEVLMDSVGDQLKEWEQLQEVDAVWEWEIMRL